jgi:hypothetical protein
MADVEFIEEIRIAQYWRKQLGEYEYVYYNPQDLHRWYVALETRGPDDIRLYLAERESRYPMQVVTGIVSAAPHPPRPIVDLWLQSHETTSTRSIWAAGAAFLLLAVLVAPNIQGCQNLQQFNPLGPTPPRMTGPIAAGQNGGPLPPTATNPSTPIAMPPSSLASPPAARPTGGLSGSQ